MNQVLSISALSKGTGVSSKTLRYWEGLGLLPCTGRTHTGYRVFDDRAAEYVQFIQKAKALGMTLREIRGVLELGRKGKNPCPEVSRLLAEKIELLQCRIATLRTLERRLQRINHEWSAKSVATCFRPAELCCLIEDLPQPTLGEVHNEKTVRARTRTADHHHR